MVTATLFLDHDDVYTEDVTVHLPDFNYYEHNTHNASTLADVAVLDFTLVKANGEHVVLRGEQHTFDPVSGAGDYSVEDLGTTLVFDVPASAVLRKVTVHAKD